MPEGMTNRSFRLARRTFRGYSLKPTLPSSSG